MRAREFLRVYNRITARFCDGARVFPRKPTKPAMEQCKAFLAWCSVEKVNPERFVRARHDATGWRFRVPIVRLPVVSDAFVDKFREWGDDKQAAVQMDERLASIVVADTNRARELTTLSERAKSEFVDAPQLCRLSADITLGYHPASEWCQRCQLSKPCREDLPAHIRRMRGVE